MTLNENDINMISITLFVLRLLRSTDKTRLKRVVFATKEAATPQPPAIIIGSVILTLTALFLFSDVKVVKSLTQQKSENKIKKCAKRRK